MHGYPADHATMIANVTRLGLPLIVCRTKSGGAHCYLFTSEPVPATLMQAKLKEWALALGYPPAIEIFPKQTQLIADSDGQVSCGSWINVPYNGLRRSTRHAFKADGTALRPDEFLDAAIAARITAAQLAAWKVVMNVEPSELWTGAPPCLQTLAVKGFGDWQDHGLFNAAVYLKKRHGPNDLTERLAFYNERFMSPPSSAKDVSRIAKSVRKKSYFYKCKDQPIVAACQKEACRGWG